MGNSDSRIWINRLIAFVLRSLLRFFMGVPVYSKFRAILSAFTQIETLQDKRFLCYIARQFLLGAENADLKNVPRTVCSEISFVGAEDNFWWEKKLSSKSFEKLARPRVVLKLVDPTAPDLSSVVTQDYLQ